VLGHGESRPAHDTTRQHDTRSISARARELTHLWCHTTYLTRAWIELGGVLGVGQRLGREVELEVGRSTAGVQRRGIGSRAGLGDGVRVQAHGIVVVVGAKFSVGRRLQRQRLSSCARTPEHALR